jgi:hypothetical protein
MATSRAKIWRQYLLAEDNDDIHKKRKLYHNLVVMHPFDVSEEVHRIIEKDLVRTYINKSTLTEQEHTDIKNILVQYVQIMPCDGYIQGFNYLAAVLYDTYRKDDIEHRMADTFWSLVTLIGIVRPMIPDHDPNDFFRYTKRWSKYFIEALKQKNHRLHVFLQPHYDMILHMITVKWMLIWFTQLFDIEDTVHLWDALITCESGRRTKLMATIAANIVIQMGDSIEEWARNCPQELHGRIWQLKAKNAKSIIEESRSSMIELKLPGV